MLERFKRRKQLNKSEIIAQFLAHPQHQWFARDPLLSRLFKLFCDAWSPEVIDFINRRGEILILQAEGHLACAMAPVRESNVVLAFPDLVNILHSASPIRALAILAHEFGHLILEHSKRNIPAIDAQVEADEFAFRLGFGVELEQVLHEYEHSIECRVRIARLTSLYYAHYKGADRQLPMNN